VEKGISDIVGCLTDPIIVFPGGWGDTIPEWLKTAITLERMIGNMKALKGEELTGTDAEACAYLYTTGLTTPMDHDWSQIYLYVATMTYRHWNKYQLGELKCLKAWLYLRRIKARMEKERAERRRVREEAEVQQEAEQPVLLKF